MTTKHPFVLRKCVQYAPWYTIGIGTQWHIHLECGHAVTIKYHNNNDPIPGKSMHRCYECAKEAKS